jgi:hypothetical protein
LASVASVAHDDAIGRDAVGEEGIRMASGRRCEKLMLKGSVPERSTLPNGMIWTVPYSFIIETFTIFAHRSIR